MEHMILEMLRILGRLLTFDVPKIKANAAYIE